MQIICVEKNVFDYIFLSPTIKRIVFHNFKGDCIMSEEIEFLEENPVLPSEMDAMSW